MHQPLARPGGPCPEQRLERVTAVDRANVRVCRERHERISINLSPLQFADPILHERVSAALRLSRLAPNRLVLEVTEGVELVIDTKTRQSFALLQLLGIRMALDDFGSGFAGLGPILELPFQLIKLDRRILAIEDEEQRGQVLTSLLLLGKAMKLEVLCEGVETPEQLAQLQQLGVRLAQGYLLGRPAAAPSGQEFQLTASLEA